MVQRADAAESFLHDYDIQQSTSSALCLLINGDRGHNKLKKEQMNKQHTPQKTNQTHTHKNQQNKAKQNKPQPPQKTTNKHTKKPKPQLFHSLEN